jgi:hypothetical protein
MQQCSAIFLYLSLKKINTIPQKKNETSRSQYYDEPDEYQVENDLNATIEKVSEL